MPIKIPETRPRKPRFTAFEPGKVIGGTEIIQLIAKGRVQKETTYKIRHLCCGEIGQAHHTGLRHRETQGVDKCRKCGMAYAKEVRRQKLWTEGQLSQLARLYSDGKSDRGISREIGKSADSIAKMAKKLDLTRPKGHGANSEKIRREFETERRRQVAKSQNMRNRSPKPVVLWLKAVLALP